MTLPPIQTIRPAAATIMRRDDDEKVRRVIESKPRRIVIEPGLHVTRHQCPRWPDDCIVTATGSDTIWAIPSQSLPHQFGNDTVIVGGKWTVDIAPHNWLSQRGSAWIAGCYYGLGEDVKGARIEGASIATLGSAPLEKPWYGMGCIGINVFGDSHVTVERCVFPDSESMSIAVSAHWGCKDKECQETTHPVLYVRDLRIGKLRTYHTDGAAIALSAPLLALVEGVVCERASNSALLYNGDFGYDRCPNSKVGYGIIRGLVINQLTNARYKIAGYPKGITPTYQTNGYVFGVQATSNLVEVDWPGRLSTPPALMPPDCIIRS